MQIDAFCHISMSWNGFMFVPIHSVPVGSANPGICVLAFNAKPLKLLRDRN